MTTRKRRVDRQEMWVKIDDTGIIFVPQASGHGLQTHWLGLVAARPPPTRPRVAKNSSCIPPGRPWYCGNPHHDVLCAYHSTTLRGARRAYRRMLTAHGLTTKLTKSHWLLAWLCPSRLHRGDTGTPFSASRSPCRWNSSAWWRFSGGSFYGCNRNEHGMAQHTTKSDLHDGTMDTAWNQIWQINLKSQPEPDLHRNMCNLYRIYICTTTHEARRCCHEMC